MIFTLVKGLGSVAVGFGASAIGSNLIKSISPLAKSKQMDVCIKLAGWALTGAITGVAVKEFYTTVTGVENIVTKTKESIKKIREQKVETPIEEAE